MIFFAVSLIRIYQITFSPNRGFLFFLLKPFLVGPTELISCRQSPTCSEYAVSAISQYGLFAGTVASLKRVSGCR